MKNINAIIVFIVVTIVWLIIFITHTISNEQAFKNGIEHGRLEGQAKACLLRGARWKKNYKLKLTKLKEN